MNAPFLRPRGCPIGVDPVTWRQAVEARIEQLHDTTIALIAALDEMESDPDLEDGADDEPSIGVTYAGGTDLELDEADSEPSFGWNHDLNQAKIPTENTYDTDDREPEEELE